MKIRDNLQKRSHSGEGQPSALQDGSKQAKFMRGGEEEGERGRE